MLFLRVHIEDHQDCLLHKYLAQINTWFQSVHAWNKTSAERMIRFSLFITPTPAPAQVLIQFISLKNLRGLFINFSKTNYDYNWLFI